MIIGLMGSGPGAGKTTLGNFLKRYIKKEVVICPFAYQLKLFCVELGWDGKKDAKGRQLLNDIGMKAREYDPNVWVNMWLRNTRKYREDVIIVDDVRFQNEVNAIRNLGGHILYIKRDGTERPDLESEGFRLKEYDHVFDNNGDEDRLRERVKHWVDVNV